VDIRGQIEKAFLDNASQKDALPLFQEFKKLLNQGKIRAAEKINDRWIVNTWVKQGILLGFRIGTIQNMSIDEHFSFYDKNTYPLQTLSNHDKIRMVPGGSAIRDGCFIGKNVVMMPPSYVNVGAYVDDETMIDSHALVGSCAQIGKRVHLSAGVQIGGVLEPVGSMPVIIEDDVLVGGHCGLFEGVIVSAKAVIGAGTMITGSTPVYDLVHSTVYRKSEDMPLIIPPDAVVVPGSRPLTQGWGSEMGLSVQAPIIIKYRDKKTEKTIRFEDLLRSN
jgi:2,3,4,5-tetrahydropyridine-2-carboxylate N-succinyltransferase